MSGIHPSFACVLPDSAITGIGVRSAVYTQSVLSFIPIIWTVFNGKAIQDALSLAATLMSTNLALAFAILVACMVEARTLGMTSWSANNVLSMSWMNNTDLLVYSMLYIHHKVGLPSGRGHVDATWGAWVRYIREMLTSNSPTLGIRDSESGELDRKEGNCAGGRTPSQRYKFLVKWSVIVLKSLHLTLMATLGIWVWADPLSFGTRGRGSRQANECALFNTTVSILGQDVLFRLAGLRVASLVIYALFVIPGLNLIVPMGLFLAVVAAYRKGRSITAARPRNQGIQSRARTHTTLPVVAVSAIFLLAITLVFLANLELTLYHNRGLQRADSFNGSEWDFAQISAIFYLCFPLWNLSKATIAHRFKQRGGELVHDTPAREKGDIDEVA